MILTGKCKEDFDNWYKGVKNPNGHWYALTNFYGLVDSMKYGIYVDFFDSVSIIVHSGKTLEHSYGSFNWYATTTLKHYQSRITKTRQEARTKAIEKANEIYNEKS